MSAHYEGVISHSGIAALSPSRASRRLLPFNLGDYLWLPAKRIHLACFPAFYGVIPISCACGRRRAFLPLARASPARGCPYAAVLTIDAPPAQLGLLAAFAYAPSLLVGLLFGGYVDRSRKRRILVLTDLVRAAILVTIPLAASLHMLSIAQIYLVAACAGTASALFDIADHAYLPRLIGRADLMEGNTKLGITESIAEIGGPALAGVLVQWLTAPIAIAANALTYLAFGRLSREHPQAMKPSLRKSSAVPGTAI
jgi:MFS family permease